MKTLFNTAIILIFLSVAQAQDIQRPVVEIPKVDRAPRLEEFLDMKLPAEWEGRLAHVTGLLQRQPRDGEASSQRTDVYLGYDNDFIYAVYICFDTDPSGVRARMNPRGITEGDDWVHLVLDTFNDQRRAYVFSSTPVGVQWDSLWTEGPGGDPAFDTLWYNQGKLTDQGFVISLAIPFKSLRFPPGSEQKWGIMFGRNIPRLNEQAFWPSYSSRVEGRLNQEGTLIGLRDITPGRNIQLLPFTGFRSFRALDQRDPLRPNFNTDRSATDAGLDAKIVLKGSLVADIAVNPDFSQVESDEPQVTTNQRFEVFFPEKRPFFLENANIFQTPINLVFTRRIAEPQFGGRLTGKAGAFTIGALVADDQSPGKRVLEGNPAFDKRARFGILRVSRDFLSQSSFGIIFTDRAFQSTFNRVGGVDARVKLNRTWVTQFQAVTSTTRFSDGTRRSGPAYEARLTRASRQLNFNLNYTDRSAGFVTLAGFNPRTDIRNVNTTASYAFRPERKYWIAMTPNINVNHVVGRDGTRLEATYVPGITWEFAGQTFLEIYHKTEGVGLRPGEARVAAARDFNRHTAGGAFRTMVVSQIQLDAKHYRGSEINYNPEPGREPTLENWVNTDFLITVRPTRQLSISNRYFFTRLGDRATGATIFNDHIVRSRWNFQFTRELSVRMILQYSSVLTNPQLTSLESRKGINTDLLFAYQANPWTALYVGYNSNAQNIELVPTAAGSRVVRTPTGFINDAHQFFAKFSYLVRF